MTDAFDVRQYYSESVDWILLTKRAVNGVGLCFWNFIEIDEQLQSLALDLPELPVQDWATSSNWDEHGSHIMRDVNTVLNDSGGDLLKLAETVLGEEPAAYRAGAAEIALWEEPTVSSRPSVQQLITHGIVTTEWSSHLRSIRDGFQVLTRDSLRLCPGVMCARVLLLRGYFLCLDLAQAGTAIEYSHAVHMVRSEGASGGLRND